MINLRHMWLMEHNPEIDWHMGDIAMMRCLASCKPKSTEERDWPSCISANKTWRQPNAHLHKQVHVEEIPESQPEHTRTELPPRFTCLDSDEWDKGD